MTQKTQKELILDHLRNFGTLEPLEALREYGIYRLGARISELRSQGGGQISKEMVASKSSITGKTVHFAKYRLTATPEAVRGQVNL